jgi:hypothetical protein
VVPNRNVRELGKKTLPINSESTNSCERPFSLMMFKKPDLRARITDELLAAFAIIL